MARGPGGGAFGPAFHSWKLPPSGPVRIDLSAVEALDTTGAWLVLRLKRALAARGRDVEIENLAHELATLLRQVEKGATEDPPPARHHHATLADGVASVGAAAIEFLNTAAKSILLSGPCRAGGLAGRRPIPNRIRIVSVVAHMQRAGVAALPIVGLLSLLIGVVMAYQGADQLRPYGATIFTVNLLGLGFLREMGVLLAAIIIAGRSGSAFTAEIGAMQVNQEVDALRTLAIDPIEVLVLPRVLALMVTLPLLGFYANVMGLVGGAFAVLARVGHPAAGLHAATPGRGVAVELLARHHQGAVLRGRDRARGMPRRAERLAQRRERRPPHDAIRRAVDLPRDHHRCGIFGPLLLAPDLSRRSGSGMSRPGSTGACC